VINQNHFVLPRGWRRDFFAGEKPQEMSAKNNCREIWEFADENFFKSSI